MPAVIRVSRNLSREIATDENAFYPVAAGRGRRGRLFHRPHGNGRTPRLHVGSKRFTGSYVLGEIVKQSVTGAGETAATHSQGLGNTAIVLNALTTGSIDVYPEYTGTIAREILKLDQVPPLAELNAKLASMGLAVAVPLGFNNTYALAIRGDDGRAKGIGRLSDLKAQPELRLGLSQEFIGRADGWPGLKRAYDLPFTTPRGLDHGLAYEAIAERQVDNDHGMLLASALPAAALALLIEAGFRIAERSLIPAGLRRLPQR